MTEQEVFIKIRPLLEGMTEGLYWDFKKTITDDTAEIIKDILAFSNSNYDGDSYIIVGVSEAKTQKKLKKITLSTVDRARLNTDANNIYLPGKWDVHGLSAKDLAQLQQFSAKMSEQISSTMLLSQPVCEYIPVQIKKSRWLYVIVVHKTPGVFISKKDISHTYDTSKVAVKQGVLYIRIADTTIGAKIEVASATEHIRVWKRYIEWLKTQEVARA